MDLKGSLVDTSLKIYPSKKLLQFLKDQSFTQNVPLNIRKIINRDNNKGKNDVQEKPKPIDVNLSNKDIEILNKIKNSVTDEVENKTSDEDKSVENPEKESEKKSVNGEENQESDSNEDTESVENESKEKDTKDKMEGPFLSTSDIEWLYVCLKEKRSKASDTPFLHELLEGSHVEVPENQVLKRNPDLEARCVKLRAQQEAREYRKMTKGVDNVRMRFPEDSISYQCKYDL